MLVLCSVLGREFALHALARFAAVSEEQLLETLDEAVVARVVSDVPGAPGRFRFAHVLIRDSLYDGLTTTRRVRLHRLAVEALDAYYGDEPGPHLAELAHHSIAGSDFERGLSYARRAGDHARALLAYEESARLYRLAIDALELTVPNDAVRCELFLALGDAESAAGDSLAAKSAFLEAAGIAQRASLRHHLARAAAGYGGRMPWARAGEADRLVPLLETGLAALADDDVELRARLLARLAGALRDDHSRDRRDRLSAEAVELARRAGNDAALAFALDGRVGAIIAPDTIAECLALSSELCGVAMRIGDRERLVAGHWNRFMAHVLVGDMARGRRGSRGSEPDRRGAQTAGGVLPGSGDRGDAGARGGKAGRCGRARPRSLRAGRDGRPRDGRPRLRSPVVLALRLSRPGRGGAVEPCMTWLGAHPARPLFRCVLALLDAQGGLRADAQRVLDDLAADEFSALPFDQEWLYATSALAETSALLADEASAEVLYGLLVPWADLTATDHPEGTRGAVARYLGLLGATLRRWEAAEAHFEVAQGMNERIGARPWLAHSLSDHARMLVARDSPDDRERADELFAAALAIYRELGMESYARDAETSIASM